MNIKSWLFFLLTMQMGISSTTIFACKEVINFMTLAATTQKRPVSNEQALYWITMLKKCEYSKHVTQPVVRSIEVAIAQDKGISKVEMLVWRDTLTELTKELNMNCYVCSCDVCLKKTPYNWSTKKFVYQKSSSSSSVLKTVGDVADIVYTTAQTGKAAAEGVNILITVIDWFKKEIKNTYKDA